MFAIADQPVEPSAYASASKTASAVRDVDLEPTELLRHHRPEELGVGDGLHRRRRGGRRGLGRVGLGLDDGRDRSRAVDDLVVDERSHGRERTDRRARRRRARVSADHEQHDREHADHDAEPRRARCGRGPCRRPTPTSTARCPGTALTVSRRAVRELDAGPHPQPGGAAPRPAARRPATSTRSFVRFATSCGSSATPRSSFAQVDGAADLPRRREGRRVTRRREAAQRTVRAVELAHDRPRPAPGGRTAWRP